MTDFATISAGMGGSNEPAFRPTHAAFAYRRPIENDVFFFHGLTNVVSHSRSLGVGCLLSSKAGPKMVPKRLFWVRGCRSVLKWIFKRIWLDSESISGGPNLNPHCKNQYKTHVGHFSPLAKKTPKRVQQSSGNNP